MTVVTALALVDIALRLSDYGSRTHPTPARRHPRTTTCPPPTDSPTSRSPSPARPPTHWPSNRRKVTSRMDDPDAVEVRAADDADRARIWAELVRDLGSAAASRKWLAIFAATDAPKTG